jgi:protein tyrosine/serine phosphatase
MFQYLYDLVMNLYNDADEIIPNLWLGNHRSALNIEFLKKNNINLIINCTQNKSFINEDQEMDIETYRIPVNDSLLEKDFLLMQKYFQIIIPLLLRKYTIEKKNILVHCHMGKQRSAIVVAALLKVLLDYRYIDLSIGNIDKKKQFDYICNYIVLKRPQAFTFGYRINFKKTFYRYFF